MEPGIPIEVDDTEQSRCLIAYIKERGGAQSEGAQEAWARLYRRYEAGLIVFAQRRLASFPSGHQDAEDVVDQAWFRVLKYWHLFEYRGKGSLKAWLRQQIKRVVEEMRRRLRDETRTPFGEIPTQFLETPAEVDAVVRREHLTHRMRGALDALPTLYRQVLELALVERKNREEIARLLGRKPNTITRQIIRGIDRLRTALRDLQD